MEVIQNEIQAISDKTKIPVHYIDQAMEQAQRNYWMSNANPKITYQPDRDTLSKKLFGINLGW